MADINDKYEQRRYYIIDNDTTVGYNYLKQSFYVTNKDTTTYRTTAEEIKKVLNAIEVVIPNIDEILSTMQNTDEELTDIFYTWEDTGSYIHTIQFNGYNTHPLTIDCEKAKLYIMNTPIIFNLNTSEPITIRLDKLCSYYQNKLGLHISQENMYYFYNLLTSYYAPTCYNQIQTPINKEEPLYYSNMFFSSNFNDKAPAIYSCKFNAMGTMQYNLLGYLESTDTSTNIIQTVMPIDDLEIGMKIHLHNANTTIDGTTYSADGTYTITNLQDNYILISENIPVSYQYPNQVCYIASSRNKISNISRDTNKVTLTSAVPDTIHVGDSIHITGTTITEEYDQAITCDGIYTVQAIEDKKLTLQEELPTNYSGNSGYIYKALLLGNIAQITPNTENHTSTISLYKTIPYNNIQYISIYNPEKSMTNLYEVSAISDTTITITTDIDEYTPNYPEVQKPLPTEETLITVTDSINEAKFPSGSFMVDNFKQVQNYLGIYKTLPIPTDEGDNNIKDSIGQAVPKTYTISVPILKPHDENITLYTIEYMTCHGLYSEVYSENTYTNE